MSFDISTHANNTVTVIVAALTIALTVGIGLFILNVLNNVTSIQQAVDMFSRNMGLFGGLVTMLVVGAIVLIAIALIKAFQSGLQIGAK